MLRFALIIAFLSPALALSEGNPAMDTPEFRRALVHGKAAQKSSVDEMDEEPAAPGARRSSPKNATAPQESVEYFNMEHSISFADDFTQKAMVSPFDYGKLFMTVAIIAGFLFCIMACTDADHASITKSTGAMVMKRLKPWGE